MSSGGAGAAVAAAGPIAISAQVAAARERVKYEAKVPSDIAISQALEPLHISAIAADAGILPSELHPYSSDKAKVDLAVRERLKDQKDGE